MIYFIQNDRPDEGRRTSKYILCGGSNNYMYFGFAKLHKICYATCSFRDNATSQYYNSFYTAAGQVVSYKTLMDNEFSDPSSGIGFTSVFRTVFWDANNNATWYGAILASEGRGCELICTKQTLSMRPQLDGFWIVF